MLDAVGSPRLKRVWRAWMRWRWRGWWRSCRTTPSSSAPTPSSAPRWNSPVPGQTGARRRPCRGSSREWWGSTKQRNRHFLRLSAERQTWMVGILSPKRTFSPEYSSSLSSAHQSSCLAVASTLFCRSARRWHDGSEKLHTYRRS